MSATLTHIVDLLDPNWGADVPEPIPAILDGAGLAQLLGLSSARLRELARDGLIIRSGRNRFDVRQSLARYVARLRDHAAQAGRPTSGEDLRDQKIRQARLAADKLEIQNAVLRGDMLPAGEVERAWAGMLRDVRAALLAVPTRCGASMPNLTSHDVAALDREIKSALEGLANGN
jgi:phage terminase Nu1 subunit (DNA packaging protein)